MSGPFRLQVPRVVVEEMIAQARAELPNECCGMLAGTIMDGVGRVVRRYLFANAEPSPTRYFADTRDLHAAFRDIRESQLVELAFYHSHPTSPPVPSKTDLAMNFYGPDIVHLIISLDGPEPVVRGWRLREADFEEAAWGVVDLGS